MSEAGQQANCAKPQENHAWIAGFVAINGHWTNMTAKLIWINGSIGELWMLFQTKGMSFEKCRENRSGLNATRSAWVSDHGQKATAEVC